MAIITISRGSFFGSCEIADCLSKKLNYEIVDREEIIKEVTSKYGASMDGFIKAIESPLGFFDRIQPVHKVNYRFHYLAFFQAVLCEKAKNNKIIYVGHVGHLLLKGITHVIKVRVIADFNRRVESVMNRQKLSQKEAAEYIQKVDKQRAEWARLLYGIDWNDPQLYDIVVKIKKLNTDTACDMIKLMAESEDFQATNASIDALNNLALESKARATILSKYPMYNYDDIKVLAKEGKLEVGLSVKSKEDERDIKKLLANIPEATDVICFCNEKSDYEDISHLYSPW
ncbi:MAG: cytidylate kinase-like family protein [Candidatus Parvarchaeota archaeon]